MSKLMFKEHRNSFCLESDKRRYMDDQEACDWIIWCGYDFECVIADRIFMDVNNVRDYIDLLYTAMKEYSPNYKGVNKLSDFTDEQLDRLDKHFNETKNQYK